MRNDKPIKVSFADEALQKSVEEKLKSCHLNEGVDAGKVYYGTGHPAQLQDFVAAVKDKRQPYIDPYSARHTVEVILGIYEANRTGSWVTIG